MNRSKYAAISVVLLMFSAGLIGCAEERPAVSAEAAEPNSAQNDQKTEK